LTAALIGVLLAAAGSVTTVFGIYLMLLALASFGRRSFAAAAEKPTNRLVILVPAHNEEVLVARCVASLLDQDYPSELVRIIVIADNCTDETASRAAEAGALVAVRTNADRGKGQALRWAMDGILDSGEPFDAAVVVDADSIVDRGFLRELEQELQRGHQVVQADYSLILEPGRARTQLMAAGFLLFHRVRLSGRRRLGMAASLVGNGMLFSRSALETHPWSAFSGVEDLEYSIDLRLAGIRPHFAWSAHIEGPAAASSAGSMRQRLRWEGGRFNVVRGRLGLLVGTMLRQRNLRLVDAAIDLATPPLSLLCLLTGAGAVIAAALVWIGMAPVWTLVPWASATVLIVAFVVVGLVSARAPGSIWRVLALAPAFLAWKVAAYGRLAGGFDTRGWERSDRQGEVAASNPRRMEVAGVPIDAVSMESAITRICSAIKGPRLFQVSTINLDFMVHAYTDVRMRSIFRRSDLNLADGKPVVWLGRLLGEEIPGRVAGADLVPALMPWLAAVGARVFLLGGENGMAAAAASKLVAANPNLQIAGTYEPPRRALEDMPSDEILARIAEAGADVLLVAFGHPKQERWIDMYRDRMPVSVAMGVGCAFDLIAGRSRRAPAWMRAIGLEWAFRLGQEPRRLVRRYATDAFWLLPLAATVLGERISGGWIGELA